LEHAAIRGREERGVDAMHVGSKGFLTGRSLTAPIRTAARTGVGCIAVVAAFGTGGVACTGGGGGGNPPAPPTTARIFASTSFSSLGAPKCTVSTGSTWGLTPIAVNPGSGISTALAEKDPPADITASGGVCTIQHQFSNVQPGRWRISVAAGSASGSCDKDVTAGVVSVDVSRGC
jgi:hypothetical protein